MSKESFEAKPAEAHKSSWTEANVLNPIANTAADAYNALIYNTVGKAANAASHAVGGKDLLTRASQSKVGESEGLSKESATQAVVTGVGLAAVYVLSGRTAGGMLRLAERGLAVEARVAPVVGTQNAAGLARMMTSEKTGQIVGSVAFDGLRDVRQGETRLGNMAGSLTAFSIYEKFNPKLAPLAFGNKMVGHAAIGAAGAASSRVVADTVSGKDISGTEVMNQMIAGGAMNMLLPGAQRLAGKGIGALNDKLGRGNPVERDLHLSGLAGKSATLDELAGNVSTLRVKTGQETTHLQGKDVSLQGKGSAADRAHEYGHEWFLKSRKDEFADVARTLRGGDEAKAYFDYRHLRLASETYAHKMEAKVAAEVGDKRFIETSSEKIANLKTPKGITYEEQWRREFEQFKATDGRVVAEIDFHSVPTITSVESMREIAARDPKAMKALMRDEYYPKLKQAFPDASEYEKRSTYHDYLLDKNGTWDAVALRGSNGQVIGGIQSQVIDVNGSVLKKAVWGEHIWLAPEARSFPNFRGLMGVAADRFRATGAQMGFMEFNDRAKMSLQELIQDAKGGLTTEAREVIWGRFANKGLNILHFKDGKIAPYAQPGMDGQAPVNYLTLALIGLDGKNLAGKKLPTQDYLQLLQKAHGTIVDTTVDPTVAAYTRELEARIAKGETKMTFARIADTTVGRIVGSHYGRGSK